MCNSRLSKTHILYGICSLLKGLARAQLESLLARVQIPLGLDRHVDCPPDLLILNYFAGKGAQLEALSQAWSILFAPYFHSSPCSSTLLPACESDPAGITLYVREALVEHKTTAGQEYYDAALMYTFTLTITYLSIGLPSEVMVKNKEQTFKAVRIRRHLS